MEPHKYKILATGNWKIWVLILGFNLFNLRAFSQAPNISYQARQTPIANTAITTLSSKNIGRVVVLAGSLKASIITFPLLTTSKIDANNNITPAATSTNTETPIIYTSSNPAVATITADGLIHLVAPGVTIITATQSGNENYSAATPATETLTVMEYQGINFPSISNKTVCAVDFFAGATSNNNTIPITYTSSNIAVATISAQGVIHITGIVGTTTITANQSGNNLFIAAQPQSQVLTIILPTAPVVSITPNHSSVCAGGPVTYTASVSNVGANDNLAYQWQVNGINAGANSPQFTSTNPAATDVVKCTVINNSACQVSGFNTYTGIAIDPYVTPSATITSSVMMPVCPGSTITFTATPNNGGTNPGYQWQVNGVNAGTNNPQFTSNNFADNDKITCIITNNDSPCLTSQTALSNAITVNLISTAPPSVTISASANSVYPTIPITFTAAPVNAGISATYQWQVNGINTGPNNVVFTTNSLNNGDKVTCTIYLNGCIPSVISNQLLVNIVPSPVVSVPNTFTPNGDGVNDNWDIPDLRVYPNCLVTIFTRYGVLIYQSKGYSKAWDGTYKGSQLPMSTYYYVIDLGNKSSKLGGYITIVR